MKKNIRKIPEDILTKLKSINTNEIVVGCAVKFKANELASGRLRHLGIELTEHGLLVPLISLLPPSTQGKYSRFNVEGEVIVRRDLPKETDYNEIDSPNWGDWSNGSHTIYLSFERYPREFLPPRELEIVISCNDMRPNLSTYIIAFRIQEVLSKTHKEFIKTLFENLNLLQENIGACGVQPAELSMLEYAKSLYVSWEILPPGTCDEAINRLFHGRSPSQKEENTASERYNFFMSLNPKSLVYGSSGFRRYFGALLEDDLVVFENIQYGNAVYILFGNWEDLSRKSRIDILSGKYGTDFKRVIHDKGWEEDVRKIVADKQNESKVKKSSRK